MSSEVQATFKKFGPVALLLAVLAGIACAVGLFTGSAESQHHAYQGYLYGFTFWVAIVLGCFGFSLLHHTIRGAWGLAILRLLEAGGGALMFVVFGLLSIPILMSVMDPHGLYHHWTGTEAMQDAVLQRKSWWLNPSFFVARTVVYFVIWGLVAYALRRSSLKEDETRDQRLTEGRTTLSAPMLIMFVVSITFAATDWTMSLDPHWYSHIYGLIYMIGGALSAIALINILVTRNANKFPYNDVVTPGLTKDLGNLMFVFTLLWAYTSLSQFLIIYMGNLPEFNIFYEIRSKGVWNFLSLFLIFGQFIVPFLLLLAPRSKAVPSILGGIAVYIFAVRFIEQYWNTMPFLRTEFSVHWMDVASVVFFGAVWFAVFSRQVQVGALIPTHDPRLKEAYEHAS